MLVHFRKRISKEIIDKINRQIVKETLVTEEEKKNSEKEEKNKGKLILDATVTPSDIKYPTDLGLLNKAREDEKIRSRIEGKFGEGKRRYGLNLIRTKLRETSENKVAIAILVMNLMTIIRKNIKGNFLSIFAKTIKIPSI